MTTCPICQREVKITAAGKLSHHGFKGMRHRVLKNVSMRCLGAQQKPEEAVASLEPPVEEEEEL